MENYKQETQETETKDVKCPLCEEMHAVRVPIINKGKYRRFVTCPRRLAIFIITVQVKEEDIAHEASS